MKLHLPKRLFTALLTAITLAAAPAALTLGSAAWGVVEDADSTDWSSNDGNTWYVTSDTENALNSINATTIDKTSVFIRATKDNVVRTVGTLTLKNADTLTIAGDWESATAHFDALTIESLVIGSGEQPGSANLTVGAAHKNGTPAQAVTINSITGSVGNLNLGASSTLTLNGPVTFVAGSVLTLNNNSNLILNNAGTVELNSKDTGKGIKATGAGTITIGSGTTINMTNTERPGPTGAIEGSVVVLGGGKLLLSGNSPSLLGYNEKNTTTATDNVYLRGSAGNMATMEITSTQNQHLSTNLYLQGYAQVTGGSGLIETYNGKITATGTNNYIDAKVQVNRDITVEVTEEDGTLELRGYVYGGTMTKTGDGTLTFSNAGANKNSLSNYTHNRGITELNTEFSFTSSLTVNAGEVQAKGKTTISGALNLQGGDLAVYGNTTISGNITQTEGTLTIQQGGNLVLDAASFAGDISLLGSGTLTLTGAYNKTTDLSFTTGVTELANFSQVGAGALNLGTVNLTGSFLMMNYEGGAIHATSLGTVAEGMELVYGKGSQLVNLGTFNQSLTLNFFDVADQLGTGVNLGLSLGGKTLEEAKALLSVNGLQGDYTLEDRGGSLYLTSTGTLTSTGWDINWGGRGLVSAPALSAEHICTNVTSDRTEVNGSYYMIDETFENGEKVVVDLQDTTNSSKSIVGGFATQTNSNTQGSVNREVWIKATAGNYAFIVGGNLANNWNGGSAADFLGDTHILVDGANVTVGSVIGANHLDSKSPTFRGNTYISVMNGTITGDIIGSGTATHNVGTNKQVGDTHVFVYNNQTNGGYVTGGGIAGGFDGQNRSQRLTLEGDTHVTVDLSEQSGALEFAKNIVGAHVYKNEATPTLVHAGTTNITLIGNSDSNTRFNGLVIGGNYSAAGGTLTAGDVNMSIGASVHNIIVGGNYVVKDNAATTAQNIAIAVSQDGHVNGNLVGGHFVDGTGTVALSGGLGDVTITLAGGTIGDTYGGSWLKRNHDSTNINQGNIHINLEGGNLNGNVYAAGYQQGSSKMTTASTKVSVDSDVAIASGVTISGGYRYADDKTGSTVTGSKTLVFNGDSQDRSSITFDSFDTIQVVNADSIATVQNLTNITNLTKTGDGALVVNGNLNAHRVTLQGGSLMFNGALTTGEDQLFEAQRGSNLIFGGADITHNINGELKHTNWSGGNWAINEGTTVNAKNINIAWYLDNFKVDGLLQVKDTLTLAMNADRNDMIAGSGSIDAKKISLSNQTRTRVSVDSLTVGEGGITLSGYSNELRLNNTTTTINGGITIENNSSNVVSFESGNAQVAGAISNGGVVNVKGGAVELNGGISGTGALGLSGGSLVLGPDTTNEVAQFNYSGGVLTHDSLTVTNAEFSGSTLQNTGVLTLNGTLNITTLSQMSKGDGSYSGTSSSENGFYTGSYIIIDSSAQGSSINYGAGFAVTLGGEAIDSTLLKYTVSGITLSQGEHNGVFYVNSGTEKVASSTAEKYYVAAGATLEFSGTETEANSKPFTKEVTGAGNVVVKFNTDNHNEYVSFSGDFTGILEVQGYMKLNSFVLGANTTLKLATGQVWSDGNFTFANDILLAGAAEDDFSFIGSHATLTGKVTGEYLTTAVNMTLTNSLNNIGQVKLTGGTTTLNAGHYGALKLAGENNNIPVINVNGATVGDIYYANQGSVNFNHLASQITTEYTVGNIESCATDSYNRNLTIATNVTLNATEILNQWGMGSITVNGILNVDTLDLQASGIEETQNVITGSGVLNVGSLLVANAGTYRFNTAEVNVSDSIELNDSRATLQIQGGTFTSAGSITQSTGTLNVNGGTMNVEGAWNGTGGTVNVNGGELNITGQLNGSGLTMNVASGATLTLGGGTAEAQKQHSIGTLSAAAAGVTLGDHATLTLGGGSEQSPVTHSIGTLSGSSSATLSLSANSSLALGAGEVGMNLTGSGELTKTGDGTLALTKANGDFTGNIIVSGGVLKAGANSSDEYFGDDYKGNKDRTITVQNGATLDVNGTEAYYHVVLEQGATITNSGTNTNNNNNGNVSSGWKALPWVELVGDAEFNAEGQMVMQRGDNDDDGTFTLDLNGHTLTKTGGNKLYMKNVGITSGCIQINAGEVQLDSGVTLESGVQIGMAAGTTLTLGGGTAETRKQHSIGTLSAAAAGVTLGNYVTLTLGGGTAEAQKQHSIGTLTGRTGSMLNLEEHSVLNTITTASGVTLSGQGRYNAGSVRTLTGIILGESWTGSVYINNVTGGGDIRLDVLGKDGSTVVIGEDGVSGYFQKNNTANNSNDAGNTSFATNLQMDGDVTITDAYGAASYDFLGDIAGDGSFLITRTSGSTNTWTFQGDIEDWNGGISQSGSQTTNLVFAADASSIKGAINRTNGTLNLQVNTYDKANFSNAVTVSKLEVQQSADFEQEVNVNGEMSVSLGKTATFNNTLTANTVSNAGQIKLGEAATVTGGSMSKVQMSSTGITGTAQDGSSSMTNADIEVLAQDASFTIQDMTLTNTSITAASVNIVDSKVSGNVVLNVVKPAEPTEANVGQGGTGDEIHFSYGLALVDSDSSLTLNMEVPQAIPPSESGLYTLTITLNGFAEGFDFSNIANQVVFGADSWLGLALKDATPVVTVNGSTLGDGAAAAQSASGAPSVSYEATRASGGNVGSLVITINGLNVPEPTTATLSLLALAALAGRRRRK